MNAWNKWAEKLVRESAVGRAKCREWYIGADEPSTPEADQAAARALIESLNEEWRRRG